MYDLFSSRRGFRSGRNFHTKCLRVKLDLERVSSKDFRFSLLMTTKNSSHVPILCLERAQKTGERVQYFIAIHVSAVVKDIKHTTEWKVNKG